MQSDRPLIAVVLKRKASNMPGMGHDKSWWAMYEAMRRQGKSKESAARITNARKGKRKVKRAK